MLRRLLLLTALLSFALPPAAQAQEHSSRIRTAAFIEVMATRGVDCELLRPWQAASLRALNLRDMEDWPAEQRETAVAEATRLLPETPCDDATLTAWTEAAEPGFDREMLPPYLAAYLALVGYEDPPKVFTSATTRVRYGPAVETIREKLSALEAAGVVPEGGMPWPNYIERTQAHVRGFVTTLANPDASLQSRNEAAAWIAQTAHIIELWLADQGH